MLAGGGSMKKQNKFNYLYVLQGYYAGAWYDLTATDKKAPNAWRDIKNDLKAYRENERGAFRIIERRELAGVE